MDPSRSSDASPLNPVQEGERIISMDVLRGVALLGIFVMNIPFFAFSFYSYFKPGLAGDFEGANYYTWLVSHILFEEKMMSIFSMLFGAGIVLFNWRIEQRRGVRSVPGIHYRRMFWLLVIGMLHAYLIWYGDILVAYAMVGMMVYPLRRLRPLYLLIIAALLLPITSILGIAQQLIYEGLRTQAESGTDEIAKDIWDELKLQFYPNSEVLADERDANLGPYAERVRYWAPIVLSMQTLAFLFWTIWRVASMMLLGMALFKLGVFGRTRSPRFYAALVGAGLATGLPLILIGESLMRSSDYDPLKRFGMYGAFNHFGSVAMALAWIGVVMLFCRSGAIKWLQHALACVGRMAFTNYLTQSLIGMFLFYGSGLGAYGKVERWELIYIILGVWAFQLVVSPLWLGKFRYGPMEWAWRCLTYWRIEPIRRVNPEAGTDR
jgi:uncharacterized protein